MSSWLESRSKKGISARTPSLLSSQITPLMNLVPVSSNRKIPGCLMLGFRNVTTDDPTARGCVCGDSLRRCDDQYAVNISAASQSGASRINNVGDVPLTSCARGSCCGHGGKLLDPHRRIGEVPRNHRSTQTMRFAADNKLCLNCA